MSMTETHLDTILDEVDACWPPKAHIIHKKDQPAKEGTIALCGAKLMGIDLENAHIDNVCPKCLERWKELQR